MGWESALSPACEYWGPLNDPRQWQAKRKNGVLTFLTVADGLHGIDEIQ